MILLLLIALLALFAIIYLFKCLINDEGGLECFYLIIMAGLLMFVCLNPIVVIDKKAGMTIGTVTSIDQNFWGSTAIYIKTSETEQEKYCAEDKDIIEFAQSMLGKKVRIGYGERVGIYPLSKCDQAPIIHIEKWEDLTNENN